ncbi:MAG: sel1 repeat family protein [Desulfuromonadales bacterium]|nr:sel1 repeat family protein [Desulfuromonadales bacterium]
MKTLLILILLIASPTFATVDYGGVFKIEAQLAEQGDAEAQVTLGVMYLNGLGVKQDNLQAAIWFRKAAVQGEVDAQYNLAVIYDIAQYYEGTAKWYRKAAEQGDAEAQATLGAMYLDGLGVEQDYVKASTWSRMAAEQGVAEAQYNLAMIYDRTEV